MATIDNPEPVVIVPAEGDALAAKAAALDLSEPKSSDATKSTATASTALDDTSPKAASKDVATTDEKAPVAATEPAKVAEVAKPIEPTQPSGPRLTPIEHPTPTSKPLLRAELTETEETKYTELLTTVKTWTEIPTTSAASTPAEPINDGDRLFLTRDCLLRYLRATKWDVPSSAKRLLATLTWRREYGLVGFTHSYISPENETGKQVLLGFDNEGRPCLYLNPSRQNTERSEKQLHHLFYMVERVVDLMVPGQETLALLVNFMDTRKGQGASVAQARTVMSVLQNHYPERLGRALITDLPWYISAFFKMISPFIDPHTRTKLKFNEPMTNYVPAEQLLTPFGGKLEFEYKHDVYWPALDALCTQRRQEYFDRWVKAGKEIGECETYLRGGDKASVHANKTEPEAVQGATEPINTTID
ncbi:CRAL/TRIO domain-containing protein [Microthyrium microscopicum]|uniref:CRAL/TRIO domain-containing protein n=1 Tax=Microthyrium microscopicum TaxID=703497 RepID=A0A6A6U7A9_9PEZI|nr:CRAL/TRIO domain-containing protein [Microthyrium microscopicum]